MRYSRIRRQDKKRRYAVLLITIILMCSLIYIISASSLGKLLSGLILPMVNKDHKVDINKNGDDPKLVVPEEDKAEKVTETISTSGISLYCIQMGAFIDMENAQDYSQTNKRQGGAGYIVEDTYYRVLAVGFKSEEDANTVKTQLKEDDIDSQIYKISSQSISLQITATQANVDIIKSAYQVWEDNFYLLEDVFKKLDRKQIEAIKAKDDIRGIVDTLVKEKGELESLSSNLEENQILLDLVDLFEDTIDLLNSIISENSSNDVAISTTIKYTYIELMMKYMDYINQLKG
jgi:hypothetical protein